jgi:hypothetical protein
MNIPRIFASAMIRKVAYWVAALVIGAVVTFAGVGEARASGGTCSINSTSTNGNAYVCTTRQAAYERVDLDVQATPSTYLSGYCTPSTISSRYVAIKNNQYSGTVANANGCTRPKSSANWTAECPTGSTWDDSSKTCFDPAQCTSKSNLTNQKMTGGTGSACSGGCEFTAAQELQVGFPGAGPNGETVWFASKLTPSGNACPAGTPAAQALSDGTQDCKPSGTLTMCIKADGQHCTKVSGTRQICWKPGETGKKTDGPSAVVREAGTNPPPAPTPPPGETFDQQGTPTTVSTTQPGKPTSTTTQNVFVTTNGTNAGGSGGGDSGEPGDGTGGEGDGKGTAAGGTSCEDPPIVSGDEPLRMVATQAWATRCAIEAGNALTVAGDIGDCQATFTVTGTSPHVETLKAQRAQICPNEGTGDDTVDQSGIGGGDDATGTGFVVEGDEIGTDGLDDTGMGYTRSCPVMPSVSIYGQTIQFDNSVMCSWLSLAGQLVLVLSALASLRILSGGGA